MHGLQLRSYAKKPVLKMKDHLPQWNSKFLSYQTVPSLLFSLGLLIAKTMFREMEEEILLHHQLSRILFVSSISCAPKPTQVSPLTNLHFSFLAPFLVCSLSWNQRYLYIYSDLVFFSLNLYGSLVEAPSLLLITIKVLN